MFTLDDVLCASLASSYHRPLNMVPMHSIHIVYLKCLECFTCILEMYNAICLAKLSESLAFYLSACLSVCLNLCAASATPAVFAAIPAIGLYLIRMGRRIGLIEEHQAGPYYL